MKVLITGASSGIGRDMAREFAKRNFDLVIVARNTDKLEELKKELEGKYRVNIKVATADLTVKENCIKLFNENKDVNILVNNAGFGIFGNFNETDLEKDLQLIKTNIIALHILTKLYLQEMVKRNEGTILNVSSIAGSMPGPLMSEYYASKSYVLKLSEGIREELKKKHSKVKISVLQPGPVRTNFNNVAGVKFNLMSCSSEYVAKYTVKQLLRGKFNIIPTLYVKVIKLFSKLVPDFILAKVCYHMQRRKGEK